jgi:alpha-tubulin suppressor-like RCC1 family protein
MTSATAVAAGSLHTCVLQTNRHVSCWGANGEHQLGDGGTTPSDEPFEVSGIGNATSIASGFFHSCAVRAGGTVACWGRNAQGQLGNGSSAPSAVPVAVSGLTDATEVVTGISHTCALRATGEVVCWGADNEGQLGNGLSDTSTSVPTAVTGITNATGLEAGLTHACARLATGEVKCWGGNQYGQLGDGSDNNARATPVLVSGLTDATAMTAGWSHTCARRTSGALACWGAGANGELGNGTNPVFSNTPVAVTGFP